MIISALVFMMIVAMTLLYRIESLELKNLINTPLLERAKKQKAPTRLTV